MKTNDITRAMRNASTPAARLASWQAIPVSKRLAAIRDRLAPGQYTSSCMIQGTPDMKQWRNALMNDPAFYLAPVPYVYTDEKGNAGLTLESLDSPLVADYWDPETDRTLERSIGHTGWYADEYYSETIRPAVVELKRFPGILFAATVESMGGMIAVDLTTWETVDFADCQSDYDAGTARHDCARSVIQSADSIAQRMAEDSREYYRKDQVERDIEENRETLKTLRHEIRELARELKTLCPSALASEYPAAGKAVLASLRSLLADRRELMTANEKLAASL
jgi:hypothetical protein